MSNKYRVYPRSILISKLNPRFPRVWPVSEVPSVESICSTEFQVVLPKDIGYYSLIYCFLKSQQVIGELTAAAGGTSGSHQRVKPEDIFNLTFLMPDQESLAAFNRISDPLMEKIETNVVQIRTLEKLSDTLLPKLMTGDAKVDI